MTKQAMIEGKYDKLSELKILEVADMIYARMIMKDGYCELYLDKDEFSKFIDDLQKFKRD